jgi:hypothetical protein
MLTPCENPSGNRLELLYVNRFPPNGFDGLHRIREFFPTALYNVSDYENTSSKKVDSHGDLNE